MKRWELDELIDENEKLKKEIVELKSKVDVDRFKLQNMTSLLQEKENHIEALQALTDSLCNEADALKNASNSSPKKTEMDEEEESIGLKERVEALEEFHASELHDNDIKDDHSLQIDQLEDQVLQLANGLASVTTKHVFLCRLTNIKLEYGNKRLSHENLKEEIFEFEQTRLFKRMFDL